LGSFSLKEGPRENPNNNLGTLERPKSPIKDLVVLMRDKGLDPTNVDLAGPQANSDELNPSQPWPGPWLADWVAPSQKPMHQGQNANPSGVAFDGAIFEAHNTKPT